jgi:pyruvate/2-oxoglutarate dehydrogenase complex dihydrolipoamide dehydrogenase (E3) component
VPSKAFLKAAKVAHEIRTASRFGITANPPIVEMANVRAYVRQAIEQVYRFESPEELQKRGIEVMRGAAGFVDSRNIQVGDQLVRGRAFLITTGARPQIPPIEA